MSILVIFLTILLLIADSLIFFTLGVMIDRKATVEKLKEKGWKIEPPEV